MEGCNCIACRQARESKALLQSQQPTRGSYAVPSRSMSVETEYAMDMEDSPYSSYDPLLDDIKRIPTIQAKELPKEPEQEPQTVPNISPDDVVIAVMGVTGAGKTTFIQKLTNEALKVGGSLESCTHDVAAHLCKLPGYPKKIWLLDTPGFDDTYKSDAQILADVATYLSDLYSNQILLTGIIYLHRIQDPRTGQAAMRNIRTFKKLCGEDGLSRTVLVTTFWRYVTPEEGRRREEELLSRGTLWKFITDRGGKAFQYRENEDSAKKVIDYIIESKLGKAALTIQVDLVDRGKKLGETEAGEEVKVQMAQLQKSYEKEIERLKTELEEVIRQKEDDVKEMREMLEAETLKLKKRVEQIEQGGRVFELSDDGLRKRMKTAWRVIRQKA